MQPVEWPNLTSHADEERGRESQSLIINKIWENYDSNYNQQASQPVERSRYKSVMNNLAPFLGFQVSPNLITGQLDGLFHLT